MRVSVVDYGVGNLHSIAKALALAGADVVIESDVERALRADAVVLPGVGAFSAAASRLLPARETFATALQAGKPCLGVCLGMQLLFSGSEEGNGRGLDVIPGQVTRLAARNVPQMGWNDIASGREPLLERSELSQAYYANSYVVRPADPATVTAWSTHESDEFPAVVRAHRCVGVQFHPEKSSAPGLAFLQEFLRESAV
jgi:imidazole glycerol-phosphate synthase subunit HisH